jgi:tellurite resistance protein TerC
MLHTFRFLKPALIVVLLFIGIKMCLIHTPLKIPNEAALGIVLGILATGVLASLLAPHPKKPQDFPTAPELPGGDDFPDEGERAP